MQANFYFFRIYSFSFTLQDGKPPNKPLKAASVSQANEKLDKDKWLLMFSCRLIMFCCYKHKQSHKGGLEISDEDQINRPLKWSL